MQMPSREELKQRYEHMNMSELIKRVREDKNMTYQDIADRLKNPSITTKDIKEYEEIKIATSGGKIEKGFEKKICQ